MTLRAPLIGAAVCVVLAIAFYFLLWSPADDEQAELEAETAQLESQAQALRNEIAQLREIEANQVEVRAALARLEEFVPSGPAQPTAVRQFQESADAAGTEILSVSFGAVEIVPEAPETGEPGTVLASIPVTMVVEGGYFQAVDYLRRLEIDVPRAILVENITVGEGSDGFPQLATTWGGRLFTVVPSAAAGEPDPDAVGEPEPPETTDDPVDDEAPDDDTDAGEVEFDDEGGEEQ